MANILENIAEYNSALEAVKSHCMCANVRNEGSKLIIEYPEGDFAVQGIRVDRNAVMLRKAVSIMERHWLESFPGFVAA